MPLLSSFSDKPIFSIDIHPDGSRFATGGQGKEKLNCSMTLLLLLSILSVAVP